MHLVLVGTTDGNAQLEPVNQDRRFTLMMNFVLIMVMLFVVMFIFAIVVLVIVPMLL